MEFMMFLPDVTSGRRKLALLSDSLKLRRGHCPKKLRVNATVNQKQIAKSTQVVRRDKINRGSWGNGRPVGRARVEKQDAIKKAGGRHGGKVHGERKGKGEGHEALRAEFMSVAIVRILLIDNIRSFFFFFCSSFFSPRLPYLANMSRGNSTIHVRFIAPPTFSFIVCSARNRQTDLSAYLLLWISVNKSVTRYGVD